MNIYGQAAPEYFERGWNPLPLFNGKGVTPPGMTGYAGALVTAADVARWSKSPNVIGLTLRLVDTVGIDVDAYKDGCEWEAVKAKQGPLPPTWVSSSRFGDGYDGVSGIRLYRLPAAYLARQRERCWHGVLGEGIDVVRFAHRQVNSWPTVHKRGTGYQWLNEATGEIVDGPIPCRPEDLPELPLKWAEAMIKPEHPQASRQEHRAGGGGTHSRSATRSATPEERAEVESWWTPGVPCPAVARALEDILDLLPGNRHDTAVPGMLRLTRLGEQGHQGVLEAVTELQDAFIAELDGDPSRTEPPEDEWSRAEAGIYRVIAEQGFTPPEDHGCCLGYDEEGLFEDDLDDDRSTVEDADDGIEDDASTEGRTGDDDSEAPTQPTSGSGEELCPPIRPVVVGGHVPFPVEVLPQLMAAAVCEVADAVMVDPAIPGQAALTAVSGLLGAKLEVVILETWHTHCNLYFCTVADSADGKSPGSLMFWEPLHRREATVQAEAEAARLKARVLLPILNSKLDEMLKGSKDGDDPAGMIALTAEIAEHEKALRRKARVVVDDVTPEQLAAIMADNDGVIIAINDEGTMIAHLLGMYSKAPNVGVWLKSWGGDLLVVDRKGSGFTPGTAIQIKNPRMTFGGSVQPTVVADMGSKSNLEDRGALGRVLFAWPQSKAGTRMLQGHRPKPYTAVPAWNAHLLSMVDDTQRQVVFSTAAQGVFTAWHDKVEAGLNPAGLYADLKTFAPKIRESVARLAGLFARIDGAAVVTADHVSRATTLGDYYLAHAKAVVESWASGQKGVALNLLKKIGANRTTSFTRRDATRMVRNVEPAVMTDALELLAEHGYLKPADPKVRFGDGVARRGTKSPVISVNPMLFEGS